MARMQETPTHWYYAPGTAPFGELSLIRVDHDRTGDWLGQSGVYEAADVVVRAWSESDWLRGEVGAGKTAKQVRDEAANLRNNLERTVVRAQRTPRIKAVWLGITPPATELGDSAKSKMVLRAPITQAQIVGFASATYDVSGNLLERAIKRVKYPDKVYAALSDVDVKKPRQRQKIGTALAYVSLLGFAPDKIPTTYVPARNSGLIDRLAEFSFKPTGSRERTDLIDGVAIEEVRLQGENVGVVLAAARKFHPWLTEAQAIEDPSS